MGGQPSPLGDHFRDQLIAASLKPEPLHVFGQEGPNFRDQLIAASLKPVVGLGFQPARREFPRSIDRGLIEATQLAFLAFAGCAHFRDQLIAASLKLKLRALLSPPRDHFRDQLIAASLKLSAS